MKTLDFEIRLNERGYVVVAPGELDPTAGSALERAKYWLLAMVLWLAVAIVVAH